MDNSIVDEKVTALGLSINLGERMLCDIRAAIPKLATMGTASGEDAVCRDWLVYLLILTYDTARGALSLVMDNPRAANTLQRQLYEYIVTAKFFLTNPDAAIAQIRSRKERHYHRVIGLDLREEMLHEIEGKHAEWRKANPGVTEYDGAAKFKRMALDVDTEERYNHHYQVPSILVHADVVGFMDVFDESDYPVIRTTMQSQSVKPEGCAATVVMFLKEWLRIIAVAGIYDDPNKYDLEIMKTGAALAREWRVPQHVWPSET